MHEINYRVKHLRELTELSQAKFAERISMSQNMVNAIEHNKTNIKDSTIKLICMVYDVNESWLKYGIGDIWINQPWEDTEGLDPRVVKKFKNLNQHERELVLKIIEVVQEQSLNKVK